MINSRVIEQEIQMAAVIKQVRKLLPKWNQESKEFQCACYDGVIKDLIKALDGETHES
jgi:hypothetical protein